MQVVFLAFDMVRIELPYDDVRDARKIWNHVDELRVEPDLAVLLAKNGLRVGVGSPQSWPAIRALLATARVRPEEQRMVAQAGAPVSIQLFTAGENEPIFIYGRDNRLTGRTVSGGDKLLILDYDVRPEADRTVDLRLTFEVRRDMGVMTWERIDGAIREVPALERYTFDELRPTVSLASGEFLVVGLGETGANPYLMGNRFLSGGRAGERFETLLFLSPGTIQMTATGGAG